MDDADLTQARLEREEAMRERATPATPYQPAAGKPGDCDLCGEWCGRLIHGACARCRDQYGMP